MLNKDLTQVTELSTTSSTIESPRFALLLNPTPGVLPEDSMTEAGRKILFHQLEIMLQKEPEARIEGNIDAIHDMRVATRRMRSAIRIVGGFYRKSGPLNVFSKSLKQIAAALGGVRDLDVFRSTIHHYVETLPEEAQGSLDAFRDSLNEEMHDARKALHKTLDSERYARFVDAFHAYLTAPSVSTHATDDARPYQVRHIVPGLIYERYTAMRAYEAVLEAASLDTLHELRIEGKQLRYTLEFFAEVLGAESKTAIEAVKALQDHLGTLQDARVACEKLQTYMQQANSREDLSGVSQYLAVREAEKQQLLASLPSAWQAFTSSKTRRAIALSVAAL